VPSLKEQLADALDRFDGDANVGTLFDTLRALVRDAEIDDLIAAAEPLKDRPEIMIPVYGTWWRSDPTTPAPS